MSPPGTASQITVNLDGKIGSSDSDDEPSPKAELVPEKPEDYRVGNDVQSRHRRMEIA